MIAHLHGELARVEADYVVIDVGGVGYKVHAPLATITQLPRIGEQVSLLVTTVVREDAITLYAFADEAQQGLFELLLTVSGVGPKVALNILSVLPVEQVIRAISTERFVELNAVPGVGIKTAQRIVLELREKITTLVWAQAATRAVPAEERVLGDAIEALLALGYSRGDARTAVEHAVSSASDKRDTGSIVRESLKLLSR